jgi:hypothetical protein
MPQTQDKSIKVLGKLGYNGHLPKDRNQFPWRRMDQQDTGQITYQIS